MNGEDLMTLYREIVGLPAIGAHATALADPETKVGVLSLVRSCPKCAGRVVAGVDSPASARCTSCDWRAA